MFDYLTTIHYGRCVKQFHDWYVKSFAVNRIYYIHQGDLTVLLDNVPYRLQPNRVYLFPQNLKFEPLLTRETCVDHTFLDFLTLPAIKMVSFLEIDPVRYPLIEKAVGILFELVQTYPTYLCDGNSDFVPLVESYLGNALRLISRQFPIHTITDARINQALEYIHKNYAQEITLERLAKITNLEKNYFIRLFRQAMNMTPYQYLRKYRFNVALTLIKWGHPLTEVALQIGYSDISAFSHAFKQVYGIYPSEIIRGRMQPSGGSFGGHLK